MYKKKDIDMTFNEKGYESMDSKHNKFDQFSRDHPPPQNKLKNGKFQL